MDEGYVKYVCHHTPAPAPVHAELEDLDRLRFALFKAGLIGMRPDGVGFGNLSVRAPDFGAHAFVITSTGTGGVRELGPDGYCLVSAFSLEENRVFSSGPLQASSEAMSHGALYAASPVIRCVVHVHSQPMFDSLLAAGAVNTPPDAAYGTPDMARAVYDAALTRPVEGVIVMTGHPEGILIYGPSIDATASLISFISRLNGDTRHA